MTITIDETYCKGCSLCIAACGPQALDKGTRRNATGYVVPELKAEKCVACGNCEWTCPEMAITVTRPERNKGKEHA